MASHLERFEKRSGIHAAMCPKELPLPLDSSRATMVYRIFQEALTNVARHAQATEVEVRLAVEQGRLHLHIEDNGRGMPAGVATAPESAAHCFGLLSMKERARELGGALAIESTEGLGTTIMLCVPLDPAESDDQGEHEKGAPHD